MEFKNVSGMDLDLPALRRVVEAGEVVEVLDEQVAAGLVGQDWWELVGAAAPVAPVTEG